MNEYPRPCRCGSRDLHPRWDDTHRWIECGACGNTSKKLKNKNVRQLVKQWDDEQKENKK